MISQRGWSEDEIVTVKINLKKKLNAPFPQLSLNQINGTFRAFPPTIYDDHCSRFKIHTFFVHLLDLFKAHIHE